MTHVSITDLCEELEATDGTHREVLETHSMTVDVGRYPSSTAASKNPHNEDELYYVLSGAGKLRVGDETYDVEGGDLVYVEPEMEHDFFAIEEAITVLIVFGSATDPTSYGIRRAAEHASDRGEE
ncbi:cupin domain-containing protein [Natronobacterium gregoryi]|uniref:Cupin domain-containing protein n=2 Tax=Natronobacterium gregoryi TaxID=44930 RepID=L0AM06_NATGS|nr:cupin domain-containing protein [Natronobacterium gregoryi]AFZ74080.1 cupin domain-containing protein [Natronobacterium gregoryi SP2]ELY70287.1 mannose-1-phosphate guanylyltransferase (GDP) [Natronobacterium gregoryi SP2]PLK18097.1 cupin domain-containing protein [Natronobacterium gregoryi SP2]SFJ61694.1 mannose-1-phosphate guanylyltransferase [Natronobacterium gregoryi]